jgi:ADP-dependent NAD(P)H-hydrate dehydratase / NAD(P)H-hydrate epimerase
MKIISSASMKEYDRKTIELYGLPGIVLMETAAFRVFEFIKALPQKPSKVVVLSGPGNNGGDGLVVARLLLLAGYQVSLWSTVKPGAYRGDAAINEKYLLKRNYTINRLTGKAELELFKNDLDHAGLLVDALLGTGIDREVEGLIADLIKTVNGSDLPVLAVDIPSGVNADNGSIMGSAVQANWTVTFAFLKKGLLLYPGAGLAGEIFVAEINIPNQLAEKDKISLLTPSFIRQSLPVRLPDAHKGSLGRTLLVAGSAGMTGAAVLAAESALTSGSGLVYLAAPASICAALEAKLIEVIVIPLPEKTPGMISPDAASMIIEKANSCNAMAVGPGLDTGEATAELLFKLVQLSPVPLVIDAGALNALGRNKTILRSARHLPLITPHPGEMARLAGVSTKQVQVSRLEIALKNAAFWNCYIILKGANSIVATPDGQAAINPTGNVALATAGSGDLLTGMVTSLIAQGMSTEKAAMAGTYIHGLAGDHLPAGRGYCARDILNRYAEAFSCLDTADLKYFGNPCLSRVRPL